MRKFNLILGIIEICFLPVLLIVLYINDLKIGLIHGAIGGVFLYLGVVNIKNALSEPEVDAKRSSDQEQ